MTKHETHAIEHAVYLLLVGAAGVSIIGQVDFVGTM